MHFDTGPNQSKCVKFGMCALGPQSAPRGNVTAPFAIFVQSSNLKKMLTVRLYDDAGKVPDMDTPSFWHFAPLVQKMVDSHCSGENN